ncbi:precorrin-3B synthase [Prauserella sediminis]|uniref:Precorrin-3B synthase n=1 Tax=Prauserella sediminis TaxID=577680 RepID=A0A839XNP6_9PSEU|nr:precorrin-3B synthase [Prauserella sediminis]MBB3661555.1 precorrin-3B synthase [Prauserella sediminis]
MATTPPAAGGPGGDRCGTRRPDAERPDAERPGAVRLRADACPGVLATHDAADGPLARVRLPGGGLSPAQAQAVAACATELGDGAVHLTSRGNLQLRAVSDVDALVGRFAEAELLPSPGHERIRNILGSPLSGLARRRVPETSESGGAGGAGDAEPGRIADVRPLVRELDAVVCATPELTGLPGRFLFALDDGGGDVAADADLCWRATAADTGAVLVAGTDTGLRVPASRAAAAMVAGAQAFDEIRATAWRIHEIDPSPVVAALRPYASADTEPVPQRFAPPAPVGPVPGVHAVVAAPRFGQLSADTLRQLAGRAGDGRALTVTPWRTVVVHDTSPGDLAVFPDLVVDPADPLLGVSACIGAPRCAKSHADVRADALALAPDGISAHFAGCSRRCGRPGGSHIDVVAAEGGYHVGGTFVGLDRVAEALSASSR